jgi:ribosomal protein L20A (L18A)
VANKLVIRVEVDAKAVASGVATATGQIDKLEKATGRSSAAAIQGALAFAKYAAAAAAAAIGKAIKDQLDLAASIREVQRESGASRDTAAALVSQLEVLGVSADGLGIMFRTLNAQMQNSPEQFAALGISLKNADGSARSAFDVFMDLRRVLAESRGDSATLTVANELLGRSYQDLLPLLNASEEDLRAIEQAASDAGVILSGPAQQATEDLANAQIGLQTSLSSVAQTISDILIPALADMTEAAAVGIDMLAALATTAHAGNWAKDVPILGGLINVLGGAQDILMGNSTDQLAAVNEQVNRKEKARAQIAAILNKQRTSSGQARTGPSLAGATSSALAGGKASSEQAARDEIDAIREAGRVREQAMRDALELYQREREAAIDTARTVAQARQQQARDEIDATRKSQQVRAEARRDEIDALRDDMAARDRARDSQVRAIREVMDVERSAFDARQKERDAARGALEEQLAAMEQEDRERGRAADLQKALDEKAASAAEEPVRVRSESLEDFTKRHAEWTQRMADADAALAALQVEQARDVERERLEAQVGAIDAAGQADREQQDARQAAHEAELSRISKEAEADQLLTDQKVAAITTVMEAEQKGFDQHLELLETVAESEQRVSDARIDSMQRELDARTQQEQDEIEALRRETDATVAELQTRLQQHQTTAAAISASYPNIQRTVTYTVQTVGTAPGTGGGGGGGSYIAAAGGYEGMVGPGHGGPRMFLAGEGVTAERVSIRPTGRAQVDAGISGGPDIVVPVTLQVDGATLARVVGRKQYDSYRLTGGKN